MDIRYERANEFARTTLGRFSNRPYKGDLTVARYIRDLGTSQDSNAKS